MFTVGTPVRVITKRFGEEQFGLTGKVMSIKDPKDYGFDCSVRIDDKQGPYFSRHQLYFNWDHIEPLELKYDPLQQGDTDEDI